MGITNSKIDADSGASVKSIVPDADLVPSFALSHTELLGGVAAVTATAAAAVVFYHLREPRQALIAGVVAGVLALVLLGLYLFYGRSTFVPNVTDLNEETLMMRTAGQARDEYTPYLH